MMVTWLAACRVRNFGIVDVVWSAGFAPVALLYSFLAPSSAVGHALSARRVLITAMVIVWSFRLAIHLGVRVASHHPIEDVRYAKLREEWGGRVNSKMFWFFQLQAALQIILSLPIALINRDAGPAAGFDGLGLSGAAGLAIWGIGLAGESIADRQLAGFRRDPQNKGSVCQVGLWRYSRHPNYFFEWLIWVGYAVFAVGSPMGWLGLVAPALMLHFLLNVTGVPMTEELSVKSKGEAYREYQRTTSAFVPWFPKHIVKPSPAIP
jgi:steroid 5-alpha reductase family enzyme